MPAKKKGERVRGFDITAMADFRPPTLSQTVIIEPPETPPSNPTTPPMRASKNNNNNNNGKKNYSLSAAASSSASNKNNNNFTSATLPDLNLSENQQSLTSNNNNESSSKNLSECSQLIQQLTASTGGILFHHTTDKEYHHQHRHQSKNKSSAVESERLLYVLNTYQFVVSPSALVPQVHPEMLQAMLGFDEFPPWHHICAVVQNGEFEDFTCPICLDTPQAPRMTLCGHVFCAPCWIAHATEREHVAARKREKATQGGVGPNSSSSSSAPVLSVSTNHQKDATTPCPVCSKCSHVSSTKPLMFVPSCHAKLESNKTLVEFTRLQRLRRAPVFFRPATTGETTSTSEFALGLLTSVSGDGLLLSPTSSSNCLMENFATSASSVSNFAPSTPLTACVPTQNNNNHQTNNNNNNASMIRKSSKTISAGNNNNSGAQFPGPSSSTSSTSMSNTNEVKEYLDVIPPLCLDNADEATLSSRYVAFNASVVIDWADRQMMSLAETKFQVEDQLAAVIASGFVPSVEQKTNPMAAALQAQLTALQTAIEQLSSEVRTAASPAFPNPMPREFAFPVGLFDAKSNPENIVDVYRRSGPGPRLFLHPMSTRMLQEDAVARNQPLPQKVLCCVEDVESITQNLETRKHKSFSHIPLGASYAVAFCDWRPKMLLQETARKFDQGIDERRDKIRRMLTREAKIEKKAEEYMHHVNQVRAQRDQQLMLDFGYRADFNSTSMLNEDDIARRNAEAFSTGLSDNQGNNNGDDDDDEADNNDSRQQQKQNKNKNNTNNNNNRWKSDQEWRQNLPSLSDLPKQSSIETENDVIDDSEGSKKEKLQKQPPPPPSTTTKSGKQIYIQLKKNTSPSLAPVESFLNNNSIDLMSNAPSLPGSNNETSNSNKGKWGQQLPLPPPSSNNNNNNNTVPAFSWGKPDQQQQNSNVGKPLSFSEMIGSSQQQQQQQQKKGK